MFSSPRTPHVLAINDDPTILAVYAELLAEEGYAVTTELIPFTDPAEVAVIAPDVIVLDLLIGYEERGVGFLAMLKGDPATRDLPVLVCSADTARLSELEERFGAWECGVVRKPFDIDAFAAAVRACLEGSPTREKARSEVAA